MRKKILFVTYSVHGGGVEKTLRLVLQRLDRTEFEPHLCVFSLTGHEKDYVPADVPLHLVSTRLRPASLFLIPGLFRLLRELKPDKVFSFMWSVNLISLAAGAAAGVPVLANEATVPSENIKEYFPSFLRRLAITFLYRKAEAVVAIAEYVKNDLVRNFSVPAEKVETVHNGIEIEAVLRDAKLYAVEDKNYVFSCGGLVRLKNQALLVAAASGPEGFPLIIAGEGPLAEELTQKARAQGANLKLTGYLQNPYPYFAGASVFVLTSLYEGFGNVLTEAMACGVPVVAVDCPGAVREIIEDGVTGLVVPMNDPAALRAAINRILRDKTFAAALAAKAAERLPRFSFALMLAKYAALLRR